MPQTTTYSVEGIHCASCVSLIQKKLSKVDGVKSISVNLATQTATLTTHKPIPTSRFNNLLQPYGYRLVTNNLSSEKKSSTLPPAFIIALLAFVLMVVDIIFHQSVTLILFILASINLFVFGRQFITAIFRFIRTGYANMDTLVGIGTFTAYVYSLFIFIFKDYATAFNLPSMSYFDVTAVVIGFIIFGKTLESRSKLKTGAAIQKLLELQAKTAIVIKNGQQLETPVSQLKVGDVVLVKPGDKIPTDGQIIQGSSAIDESALTGESLPVDKNPGDTVIGGTINTHSAITITVTKTGDQTMLAHIIAMVQQAQSSKAPIERLADRVSAVFVPIVLITAIITFLAWTIFGNSLSAALTSFVAVLVIACPCALGLATPTGIIAGVGKGAENGILIKDAESLEKLHAIDTIILDKTGTLTLGKPIVSQVVGLNGYTSDQVLQIGASLEALSTHPLAKAIALYAEAENVKLLDITSFTDFPGKGVRGNHGKDTYFLGNSKFIASQGISLTDIDLSQYPQSSIVYCANQHQLMGYFVITDRIRSTAKTAISHLRRAGIQLVMATGDNPTTAQNIADQLSISRIYSQVLPQDKANIVSQLQRQGHKVAMVGDGINDAPALATADVSIAMSNGSDIAIESANITLLHGDISKLWQAVKLSKITMTIIKQNLFWAFIYNIIGIPLASFNLLNPIFAGSAMALSSVSVVTNSLRLKHIKL